MVIHPPAVLDISLVSAQIFVILAIATLGSKIRKVQSIVQITLA